MIYIYIYTYIHTCVLIFMCNITVCTMHVYRYMWIDLCMPVHVSVAMYMDAVLVDVWEDISPWIPHHALHFGTEDFMKLLWELPSESLDRLDDWHRFHNFDTDIDFGKDLPGPALLPPLPGGWHDPWTALNKLPNNCLRGEKNTEAPAWRQSLSLWSLDLNIHV